MRFWTRMLNKIHCKTLIFLALVWNIPYMKRKEGIISYTLYLSSALRFLLRAAWYIPATGVSNGMAGGADLILTFGINQGMAAASTVPPVVYLWKMFGAPLRPGKDMSLDCLFPLSLRKKRPKDFHKQLSWRTWLFTMLQPISGFIVDMGR